MILIHEDYLYEVHLTSCALSCSEFVPVSGIGPPSVLSCSVDRTLPVLEVVTTCDAPLRPAMAIVQSL